MSKIDFSNTENAFKYKTNAELYNAYFLFSIIKNNSMVRIGTKLLNFAIGIHFPINFIIKPTIYNHFVGGETIEECQNTINTLAEYQIGTILDYSVEGKGEEIDFERCRKTVIETIVLAKDNTKIPFSVFKITGLAPLHILEKYSDRNYQPNESDQMQYHQLLERIDSICKKAYENHVPVFIDAEDSWIQHCIDQIAEKMMQKYNREQAIVFNTLQMYRTDRIEFLKQCIEKAKNGNYFTGFKFVRGAYMEQERERAMKMHYPSPIQPDKESCDRDYNLALEISIENIDRVSICAGTHNEDSCQLLVDLMHKNQISNNDKRIWFAQLLGMSDHISFNLSNRGYNVTKYVPFGPVKDVMPYLLRRAEENTSVAGQTGRELSLIETERKRRKNK